MTAETRRRTYRPMTIHERIEFKRELLRDALEDLATGATLGEYWTKDKQEELVRAHSADLAQLEKRRALTLVRA